MISSIGTVLVVIVILRGLWFSWRSNKKASEAEAEGTPEERRAKFLEARALAFRSSVLVGFWLFLLALGVFLQGLGAAISMCDGWSGNTCSTILTNIGASLP